MNEHEHEHEPTESREDGDDPRRQERRSPIVLKVEYKRLNTFFYDYTKNISKGGTFIKTDRPLEIGTVFLFRLIVPVAADPLQLRGEVRWVIKPGEPPPPSMAVGHETGMGIRFVFGDADERVRLERRVEKLMVDSLGQLIYSRLLGTVGQPAAGADLPPSLVRPDGVDGHGAPAPSPLGMTHDSR